MFKQSVKDLQQFIIESGVPLKYGADGHFGNETVKSINNMRVPNWVKTIMMEIGVKEIRGIKHNDRVIYYHSFTMGKYSTDEVPWCGSILSYVFQSNGFKVPSVPERALSWLRFGVSCDEPKLGCVAVKSRKGGGHVCIVIGQHKDGRLYCLGGNQNDEVNIKLYRKSDFEDFRMPKGHKEEAPQYYVLNVGGSGREG
jgi:uncharacterized protein (TIGR02594 family)